MKKGKRKLTLFIALALALVMVFGMSVSVLAATNITIGTKTGNQVDLTGHSFTAYQVFKGSQDDSGALGNVQWGTGINGPDFLSALKADATVGSDFTSCTTAVKTAEKMAILTPAKLQRVAEIARGRITGTGTALSSGSNNLEDGYYLIVDTTTPSSTEGFVYNKAVFGLTKNITISPKNEVPKIEKKVEDINDSTKTEDGITWQDSADHDIGDSVPYKITVTIPADAKTYQDDYIMTITDTMSQGLTFKPETVVIKLVNNNGSETTLEKGTDFTETTAAAGSSVAEKYKNGNVVTWKTADLRAKLGGEFSHTLVITYNCVLNENAKHGTPGNPNKVGLKYSNMPDWTGDGTPPEGTTPEDTVIVFTYKTIVNKVKSDETPLARAGFTLYKRYSSTAKLPAGVTNAYDILKDLTTLETDQIWGKVREIPASSSVTSFTFPGLDDGDYILVESETPAGYNTIDPVKFTITATHDIQSDDPALTSLAGSTVPTTGLLVFTPSLPDGQLTTNVVNNQGGTLPSTGGMGTKMFTMIGGLLAAGALITLIARKRLQK